MFFPEGASHVVGNSLTSQIFGVFLRIWHRECEPNLWLGLTDLRGLGFGLLWIEALPEFVRFVLLEFESLLPAPDVPCVFHCTLMLLGMRSGCRRLIC